MTRTTQQRKRLPRSKDESRGGTPRDSEHDEEQEEFTDDGDGEQESQDGGSSGGVFSELKNVASDAALAVLAPVAKQAATKAAKYAVKKGPELIEDTVMPALEDAGGAKELVGQLVSSAGPAGGLLSKLVPGGGDDDEGGDGDAGDGTGRGRRMPIQQAVDVAAPIDIVYDQWTQFEDYPKFMHRIQRVEQRDDSHVAFHSKAWGINRMWEAEIVEQRPDERIVFKSVNGMKLTGVATFHELSERLTRIELNIDIDPDGPVEKIARGARFIKRGARADLKRFKAYVEMHEDETGAWRGEIQDGDVVSESDEGYEDEYEDEEDGQEPEASYEEEDEPEPDADEYEEEPAEAEADEYDEEPDEDGAEEEEEPAPARSRSKSSRSSSSKGRKRAPSSSSKSSSSGSRSRSGSSRSSNGGSPKSSGSGSSSRSRGSKKAGGSSSSRSRNGSSASAGKSTRGKSTRGKSAQSRK